MVARYCFVTVIRFVCTDDSYVLLSCMGKVGPILPPHTYLNSEGGNMGKKKSFEILSTWHQQFFPTSEKSRGAVDGVLRLPELF